MMDCESLVEIGSVVDSGSLAMDFGLPAMNSGQLMMDSGPLMMNSAPLAEVGSLVESSWLYLRLIIFNG